MMVQYRYSKSAAAAHTAPYQAMFAIVLKYNLSSITTQGRGANRTATSAQIHNNIVAQDDDVW